MRGIPLLLPYAIYLAGTTYACLAILDLIETLGAMALGGRVR